MTRTDPTPWLAESDIRWIHLPEPWVLWLVIVPAVLLFAFSIYRREGETAPPGIRRLLALVRSAAILGVILILFEPIRQFFDTTVIKPTLAVLIDTSYSMTARDDYEDPATRERLARLAGLPRADDVEGRTRAELVERVFQFGTRDAWRALEDRFRIESYTFDAALRPIPGGVAMKLDPSGESTRIGSALLQVLGEAFGKTLGGIVLVTDGQQNAGEHPVEVASRARSEEIPIYTVGVGEPEREVRNASIEWDRFPETALVNQEVEFRVHVTARGFEGERATVVLLEGGGREELARRDLSLTGQDELKIPLAYRPTRPGRYELTARIDTPQGDSSPLDNQTPPRVLMVKMEHIRVLYVDGYPRWEYRYLKNVLVRARETVSAHCLLLSADPDFEQESTPGLQPTHRFPTSKEDLFDYDVLIFGDVDYNLLGNTPDENETILRNIKAFVEYGGGFLMIAGESDSPRNYVGTPIEPLLPVVVDSSEDSWFPTDRRFDRPFRLRLENPYDPHEILKLESEPEKVIRLWEDPEYGLPGLYWYYPVLRAKPGATVIARHPERANKYGHHVLIATTRYPSGRTMFIAFDSSWRWRKLYGDRYHERFWLKTVQYLATNKLRRTNKRYELATKDNRSTYSIKEPITLWAWVRDEDFNPSRKKTQEVRIQTPSGRVSELVLKQVPGEEGIYEETLNPREPGTYEVWIEEEGVSKDEKISPISFYVDVPKLEKTETALNESLLRKVSNMSRGSFLPLSQADGLPAVIRGRPEQQKHLKGEEELWDDTWVLLALALLLTVEWLARKWFQLP